MPTAHWHCLCIYRQDDNQNKVSLSILSSLSSNPFFCFLQLWRSGWTFRADARRCSDLRIGPAGGAVRRLSLNVSRRDFTVRWTGKLLHRAHNASQSRIIPRHAPSTSIVHSMPPAFPTDSQLSCSDVNGALVHWILYGAAYKELSNGQPPKERFAAKASALRWFCTTVWARRIQIPGQRPFHWWREKPIATTKRHQTGSSPCHRRQLLDISILPRSLPP